MSEGRADPPARENETWVVMRETPMADDRSEADQILREDWMEPGYALLLDAPAVHPQRDLIEELKWETDERGGAADWSRTTLMTRASTSGSFRTCVR